MGYIVVISVPAVLLLLITALACYLIGRNRARAQAANRVPQFYGPPAPPIVTHTHDPEK